MTSGGWANVPPGSWQPIRLAAEACLRVGGRGGDCDRCAEACPAAALVFRGRSLRLAGDCHGCGRCAAACPTDALDLAGFEPRRCEGDGLLALECARVPVLPGRRLTVPCLGGVTANLLLALFDTNGCKVALVDRGWCADCRAGGTDAAGAAAAVSEAAALLAACGVPEAGLPEVLPRPLSSKRALPLRPITAPPVSRRAALTVLGIAGPVEASAAPAVAPKVRPRIGRRRLAILARIAARRGQRVPAVAYWSVAVSPACDHSAVCTAVCPTGALRGYEVGAAAGLAFEAEDCIGCGRCAELCPSGAIQVAAATVAPSGRQTLTRHALRRCTCSASFVAPDHQSSCARCRKSTGLVQAALALKGRHPAPAGAQTGRRAEIEQHEVPQ